MLHRRCWLQAKALGDELVVGLIPDREIRANKGPPVLDEKERLTLVDSVKWVDEIITGAAVCVCVCVFLFGGGGGAQDAVGLQPRLLIFLLIFESLNPAF